jgi:hypothetical protein
MSALEWEGGFGQLLHQSLALREHKGIVKHNRTWGN